ncbi:hypothetical protein [Membranihabitans maritimus]|uniref:hypothetical protein n=1 Tax=Membranihabitans maritimus TaxID=2904244 RepID=UPI001F28EAA2|nr:hypothetical protein [Membranihabitans maritimus]
MNDIEKHINELKEQGWNELRHILDREMPENIRRVVFFRTSAAVLFLLLLSISVYLGLKDYSLGTGGVSKDMTVIGPPNMPLANNWYDGNDINREGNPAGKAVEVSNQPNTKIDSGRNFPISGPEQAEKRDVILTTLEPSEHLITPSSKIDDLKIAVPENKIVKIANLIPNKYSPLNTGKVDLSIKVNEYNDSTRIWPNARIKPSLFTGTVWVPTRGIGFFNLGGGITYEVGDWSIALGMGLSKFLSRDIHERDLVNLVQYDDTKNVVNNLYENQMDLNAQFNGEFNRSSYTQLQTKWGYVFPVDVSWKPGNHLTYSVKGGVYFLRSKHRVIYTVSLLSEGDYVTRTEHLPYLGGGVSLRWGESYSIGLESMVLDPFSYDHFWAIGATLAYQF